MPAGLARLPIRSSPTSRGALRRASQLVDAPTPLLRTTRVPATMLPRGRDQAAKATAARDALARQPFPSSGLGAADADIRQQFKRLDRTGPGAANASARVAPPPPRPATRRPVNSMPPGRGAVGGQLQSLCANAGSFKDDTPPLVDLTGLCDNSETKASAVVDLTGPGTKTKAAEAVWFAEDDFSDDENLDLDYEAPNPLPALPPSKPLDASADTSDAPIPWTSSPASHLVAPTLQRPRPDVAGAKPSLLKRDSTGENELSEVPPPKKRVLPAAFRPVKLVPRQIPSAVEASTPASKSRDLWDTSASAIKEQKKQLKSMRNQRPLIGSGSTDSSREAQAALAAKPVAISLSGEQEKVLDLVVNQNASVFFTGPAGAGKSVLMRAIISRLKEKCARDPEKVAVTASTGLAACNIGGVTLHSFSGIGLGKEDAPALVKKVRRNPKAKNRWLKTKYLIIDEISMVDGELFDKLSHVGRVIRNNGRPWGGIQLIITGDFFQLPPVPDHEKKSEGTKFAFDAATWNTSIDHTIGLTQVFRQRDPEFAGMLNEMRLGKISASTVEAFKALSRPLTFDDGVDSAELFPTRAQVDGSNERRLRELPGQVFRYEAMDTGDAAIRDKLLSNMMSPKSLDLKINAQVMLIKNLDETLVNGSLGKVIAFSDEKTYEMTGAASCDSDVDDSLSKAKRKLKGFSRDADAPPSSGRKYPVVQFVSTGGMPRTILCQPEEWKVELPNGEVQAKRTQLPLILAWALSIHKAQGQTLERVTVNLGRVFEKGQAYVALSRATCQEGLRVLGFDKSKVMAHARVVDFYNKLYSVEQLTTARPGNISDFIANRNGARRETAAPAPMGKAAASAIMLDDDEEAMASYG